MSSSKKVSSMIAVPDDEEDTTKQKKPAPPDPPAFDASVHDQAYTQAAASVTQQLPQHQTKTNQQQDLWDSTDEEEDEDKLLTTSPFQKTSEQRRNSSTQKERTSPSKTSNENAKPSSPTKSPQQQRLSSIQGISSPAGAAAGHKKQQAPAEREEPEVIDLMSSSSDDEEKPAAATTVTITKKKKRASLLSSSIVAPTTAAVGVAPAPNKVKSPTASSPCSKKKPKSTWSPSAAGSPFANTASLPRTAHEAALFQTKTKANPKQLPPLTASNLLKDPSSSSTATATTSNLNETELQTRPSASKFILKDPPPSDANQTTKSSLDETADQLASILGQHAETSTSTKPLSSAAESQTPTTTVQVDDSFFTDHCWNPTCHVLLDHPSCQSRNEFRPYQPHEHLFLQIPVCATCSDALYCVQQLLEQEKEEAEASSSSHMDTDPQPDDPAAAPNNETEALDDYCSGCGMSQDEAEDDFLLCDADGCGRACCQACVAQAHGTNGSTVVEQLVHSQDQPWKCLVCAPTTLLQSLQQELSNRKENPPSQEYTQDELLGMLDHVEHLKHQALQSDDDAYLQHKRLEHQDYLLELNPNLELEDLQDQLDSAMQDYHWRVSQHDRRLSDRISDLLEELRLRFGMTELEYYMDRRRQQHNRTADTTDIRATAPDAYAAATAVCEQRAQQAQVELARQERNRAKLEKKGIFEPVDPKYEQEIPSELEELGSSSSDSEDDSDIDDEPTTNHAYEYSKAQFRAQWRGPNTRISKRDYEMALAEETKRFRHKHIVRTQRVQTEDCRALRQEQRQQGGGGVRRDAQQLVVAKKNYQQKQQRRTTLSSGSSSQQGSSASLSSSHTAGGRKNPPPKRSLSRSSSMETTMDPARLFRDCTTTICPPDFAGSSFVLSDASFGDDQLDVSVATELAKILQPHQKEGVQFLFHNAFGDLKYRHNQSNSTHSEVKIGGAILAHNM